jgi:sugar phosphate isomerase/epimerase
MDFGIFYKLSEILKKAPITDPMPEGLGVEVVFSESKLLETITKEEILEVRDFLSDKVRTSHLPFYDLNIASLDENIAKYSMDIIKRAIDVAYELDIHSGVMHSGINVKVPKYGIKRWLKRFLYNYNEISEYAKSKDFEIFLENTYEQGFWFFDAVLAEHPDQRFCLDIGHSNCFSDFSAVDFLTNFPGKVGEMHIHDNRGDEDAHMPIGKGNIEFESIMMLAFDKGVSFGIFELNIGNYRASTKRIDKWRQDYGS